MLSMRVLPVVRRSVPILSRTVVYAARFNSTVTTDTAKPASSEAKKVPEGKPIDPKIEAIVDSISKLTILETSQLITHLRTTLNIPDIATTIAAPISGGAGGIAGTAAEDSESSAVPKEEEQTAFAVKLESFDTKGKAKIIKEIKSLLGLSLVDAKKFVEGAPKTIKENISKEDANAIKESLEKLGGKISLE